MNHWVTIFWLFFIYSVVGWLWETIYCSIKAKKFVYRGFLVGPYCPIYGFGVLAVLYFIEPFQNQLILLYILSTIVVTVLEYLTSLVMEKLFHARWWDYSHVPFNFQGRVALPVSLFWGVGCVVIVKFVNPIVMDFERWLVATFGLVLPILLMVLLVIDAGYTLSTMKGVRQKTEQWLSEIEKAKSDMAGKKEDWLSHLEEDHQIRERLPKLGFNQKRYVKNFAHFHLTNQKNPRELRQLLDRLKNR